MNEFETYDQLNEIVDQNDGVVTVQMYHLRQAHDADRLGSLVRENISKRLQSKGLAHYPDELPSSQHDMARIYRLGTPVGDLIQAVLTPGEGHDETIRKAVSAEAQKALARIKEAIEASNFE